MYAWNVKNMIGGRNHYFVIIVLPTDERNYIMNYGCGGLPVCQVNGTLLNVTLENNCWL